jgi:hypothetical protein
VLSVRQELDLCVIFSWTLDLNRRPPTAEAGLDLRSVRVRRCRYFGNGTGFSPPTSLFPRHYHSTNAPYSPSPYYYLLSEGKAGKAWEP